MGTSRGFSPLFSGLIFVFLCLSLLGSGMGCLLQRTQSPLLDVALDVVRDRRNISWSKSAFSCQDFDILARQSIILLGNASWEEQAFSGKPSARLTHNRPNERSGMWFRDPVSLQFAFNTSFSFRISRNISRSDYCEGCNSEDRIMRNVGEGFAFVIYPQQSGTPPLGEGLSSLGYGGLHNSLAVEVDFHLDPHLLDPVQAHISVMTRGTDRNSADHFPLFETHLPPSYGNAEGWLQQPVPSMVLVNLTSPVNFIFPNVTPPYNWGDAVQILDGHVHSIRIEYDSYPAFSLSVYLDDETTPRVSTSAPIRNFIQLVSSSQCPRNRSCLYCDLSLSDDQFVLPSACQCQNSSQFDFTLHPDMLNVFTKESWLRSVENNLCSPCSYRIACEAKVGFTASTGSDVLHTSTIDIFDWTFSGSSVLGQGISQLQD